MPEGRGGGERQVYANNASRPAAETTGWLEVEGLSIRFNTLQHTATHYNTLQHIASPCITPEHPAT